jgi:hypothetical protein
MIITKLPLQRLYEQFVPRERLSQLSTFFKQTLGMTAASWSDVTAELAARRDGDSQDDDSQDDDSQDNDSQDDDSQEFSSNLDLYSYLDDIKDGNIDDIR